MANNPTGFKLGSGSLTIENSLVVGGRTTIEGDGQITWGTGNLEDDPKFTSPLAGDFSLSEYSPAIGEASPTDAPSIDLFGLPRPSPANSNPDMGAIEHERATRKSSLIPPQELLQMVEEIPQ